MSLFWLFLASLTVLGTLLYNVGVKLAGDIINPFVFTVLLTTVAMVGHLAAFGVNKLIFNSDLKFTFGLNGFLLAALAGLGVVIIDLAYFYAVKSGGLAVTNSFWVLGGLIATVLISWLFFQENLGAMKIAGVGLGVISLFLLTRS
jgi:multidrug transporter EmrE-like cation transporter